MTYRNTPTTLVLKGSNDNSCVWQVIFSHASTFKFTFGWCFDIFREQRTTSIARTANASLWHRLLIFATTHQCSEIIHYQPISEILQNNCLSTQNYVDRLQATEDGAVASATENTSNFIFFILDHPHLFRHCMVNDQWSLTIGHSSAAIFIPLMTVQVTGILVLQVPAPSILVHLKMPKQVKVLKMKVNLFPIFSETIWTLLPHLSADDP